MELVLNLLIQGFVRYPDSYLLVRLGWVYFDRYAILRCFKLAGAVPGLYFATSYIVTSSQITS